MVDYKAEFLRNVEVQLHFQNLCKSDTETAIRVIMQELKNYEITRASTELVQYDDVNTRILKRYMACLRIAGRSEKTIKQYRYSILRLFDFCGKPYDSIGVYDIRFFLGSLKEKGVSNRSMDNQRANVSAFFRWLTEEELISKNPCINIKPVKYKRDLKTAYSTVEMDALRSACRTTRERAIIEFLLASGVRANEFVHLDISDVNFVTKTVHVREGKGGKERTVYLTDLAIKHLLAYLDSRKDKSSPVLFCTVRNRKTGNTRLSTDWLRQVLRNIGARAGVENVHPHRFRRTLATTLVARGMKIQEVQQILGHTNINTTLTYVCTDENDIHSAYRQYAA